MGATTWPTEVKPATSAALDAEAVAKAFPWVVSVGDRLPKTSKILSSGAFWIKLSAIDPWNVSMKMPMPPRKTVLFDHDGEYAKPKRGWNATLVKDGTDCEVVVIAWL